VKPLDPNAIARRLGSIDDAWELVDGHHLERSFGFKDFDAALAFANRLGEVAEDMDHHPVLIVRWGRCTVTIWTHVADGLTENDFAFAGRADRLA
jgi:4a-hydroxytetrahydrobiopterin dehydratase